MKENVGRQLKKKSYLVRKTKNNFVTSGLNKTNVRKFNKTEV